MSDILVIGRNDAENLGLGWEEILNLIEDVFRERAEGHVENPPKPGIHPRDDSFIHAMPAYLARSGLAGCKWIAGYPRNTSLGLPYIQGLLVLTDPGTGSTLAVIDGAWLTEVRTAAVSGVVARRFAPRPRRLGVVGCGVQARRHLGMFLDIAPSIETVRAFDHKPRTAGDFAQLAVDHGTPAQAARTAAEAVANADLVVTAGAIQTDPVQELDGSEVAENSVILPIDFDAAWQTKAIAGSSLFCVDDVQQYEYYQREGYFRGYPSPAMDLASALSAPDRVPAQGKRVFLNLGLAMEDVALGGLVYRLCLESGAGHRVPLT
jgi:ornithine cyclodeaminase/alanine dehydrogenase-like protein (mu-crystallin family)